MCEFRWLQVLGFLNRDQRCPGTKGSCLQRNIPVEKLSPFVCPWHSPWHRPCIFMGLFLPLPATLNLLSWGSSRRRKCFGNFVFQGSRSSGKSPVPGLILPPLNRVTCLNPRIAVEKKIPLLQTHTPRLRNETTHPLGDQKWEYGLKAFLGHP